MTQPAPQTPPANDSPAMVYDTITVGDKNPLKRWIHQRRMRDALSLLPADIPQDVDILDFGAGDGELIRSFAAKNPQVRACAFEPTPTYFAQAQHKLKPFPNVRCISNLEGITPGSFGVIFCLEVFEHLPSKETEEAIGALKRLLAPEGLAIIGVPHELWLPALVKGVFRMTRRRGQFDATLKNILPAVLGRPPKARPKQQMFGDSYYYSYHLGFDHREFGKTLARHFTVTRQVFSPFPALGALFNSEVYFTVRL